MAMNAHGQQVGGPEVGDSPTPSTVGGHALPCGRGVEGVWAHMEAHVTDAHEADCPHCATARASLTQLMEATRLLVDDPVTPPPGMLDRIMDAVRADLLVSRTMALPGPSGLPSALGQADISVPALAAVLRFAVDGIDGLRAHRCHVERDHDEPFAVRVALSLSLRYAPADLARSGRMDRVEQARARIRAALTEQIGLGVTGIDIEITDVWIDHGQDAR